MGTSKNFIIAGILPLFLFLTPALSYGEDLSRDTLKQQLLYTPTEANKGSTLALYRKYKTLLGRHDFEILQQLASSWIEEGSRSPFWEKQLLALFAYDISGLQTPSDLLERTLASDNPQVQRASLALIGKRQEDLADVLLNKAMSSSFLPIRLEAAFYMAQRKSPSVTGQLESLMSRLPPPFRYFFPEFFALIGTSDAVHILRHLIDDPFPPTKIEAILSAARHGRDDLLPQIRSIATHVDRAEQEAAAYALGRLKDSTSIKKLKRLTKNPSSSVQLAASYSLFLLGQTQEVDFIVQEAKKGNLFAINLLGEIPGKEDILLPFLQSGDARTQFNAAVALLKRKQAQSLPVLAQFLIRDSKDLGFQLQLSVGGALSCWKIIPSLAQHAKESFFDMQAYTLFVKEELLRQAAELPDQDFLYLAKQILTSKQYDMVPTLIAILESIHTPGAIALLKEEANKAGAPLLRTYCQLALCRLQQGESYKDSILSFAKRNQSKELIQFRPSVPWDMRPSDAFHLTPEESSSLLIQVYETLCNEQDSQVIDLLLDAIEHGHPDNQVVLYGILLYALQ